MGDASAVYFLSLIDYIVFGSFLCLSVGVGVYHAILERLKVRPESDASVNHQCRTDEFLLGGRKMPVVPVALSLLTTFLSGITLLGIPAEFFKQGALWMLMDMLSPVAFIIAGLYFLPIFYHLNATSIYEYLERRFHSVVLRRLSAAAFIVNTTVYLGVVTYAPAVALAGVTNLDVWLLILLVGTSSTLYTTIGGLKAVVWADTLQAGVMYAGIGFVVVKGLGRIFEVAVESGRVENTLRFDPNPAQVGSPLIGVYFMLIQYNSFWIMLFSSSSVYLSLYGINQMSVQRYCSLPSLKDARRVVWMTIPLYVLLAVMASYLGLLSLAYFYNCNPLETGEIHTHDQLVALLAVKITREYYGIPGLFLACLLASTLSTVSTGYNSLAAVVYIDIIKPLCGDLNPLLLKHALLINKSIVFCAGLIATGLAYACGPLGGIIQSSFGLLGATIGPITGLFLLGIFARGVSTKATTYSFIGSTCCCIALWICATVESPYKGYALPTNSSSEYCGNRPFTLFKTPDSYDPHYGRPDTLYLSRVSTYSYPFLGVFFVCVPAFFLSKVFPPREEKFSSGRKHSLTLWGRPSLQNPTIIKLRNNDSWTQLAKMRRSDSNPISLKLRI
uniref:Sodium-coupled monocarboxylate transporter 1 n=1 Tax=Steinernema glaseri TaxID=37863 RepID=A0A1I7YXQ5_9BILA